MLYYTQDYTGSKCVLARQLWDRQKDGEVKL